MIKVNKDIPAGAIVTSTLGNQYVVLVDDAGQRGLFTKTGTWFRFKGDGLTFGKTGSGVIDTIRVFDTLPALDAISEGVKFQWTGRGACAHLETVYTRESPEVTAAKAKKDDLLRQMDDMKAQVDAYDGFIRRYR